MTCAGARALLREADLRELRETADTELSRHLRSCARCRAVAERLLTMESELAHALARATPPPLAAAIENVGRAAARRAARRRWSLRLTPVAAAAALVAGILLGRREPDAALRSPPDVLPNAGGIAVQAPPGRSVAVFETNNPAIVVIWFF